MDTLPARNPHDPRPSRRDAQRRIVTRVLLLLALAISSLVLTQCQMVGDKLTGVKVGVFQRKNGCVKDCTEARKDAQKAERQRHQDALRACNGDDACIAAENARHDAADDAIDAAFKDCLFGCHLQGGGNGGN